MPEGASSVSGRRGLHLSSTGDQDISSCGARGSRVDHAGQVSVGRRSRGGHRARAYATGRESLRRHVPRWILRTIEGVVFWVPRRIRGRSQAARAGGVQPDEAGPQQVRFGLTPPDRAASVRRGCGEGPRTLGDQKQHRHQTTRPGPVRNEAVKPNRRGPRHSAPTRGVPHAVEPAGGPAFDFRHPSNAAASRPPKRMRSDSDRRALLIMQTASRQRNKWRSTELRHPTDPS